VGIHFHLIPKKLAGNEIIVTIGGKNKTIRSEETTIGTERVEYDSEELPNSGSLLQLQQRGGFLKMKTGDSEKGEKCLMAGGLL